ncbi:unnamed protein product [Phytomonas sp. Hart1]|nr:unnamed protein product [Phytomonas sp. Hart1]|eukprot:CCW70228.1 unnamed protein product [Phytomonas sp. isolate Hart1]
MALFDQKKANELFYKNYQETKCFAEAIRHVDEQFHAIVINEAEPIELFPPKDLHTAVGGKLCRCRGMIQDISLEPILYKGTPELFYTGEAGSEKNSTFVDVVFYYVIPVPCNAHFYRTSETAGAAIPEDGAPCPSERRRPRSDEKAIAEANHPNEAITQRAAGFCSEAQRAMKNNMVHPVDPMQTHEQYLNLPYPATSKALCTACIIMVPIRRDTCKCVININDVVDFYGFLHLLDDQTDPSVLEEDEFAQFSSWHAAELSKGLVSRLFCVSYRHLNETPSVQRRLSQGGLTFSQHRDMSKRYLEREICGGDSLLAEYLLLHLCTKVSGHHEMTPIGDVPLLVTSKNIEPHVWSERISKITPVAEVFLDEKLLCSSVHSLGPVYDYVKNYIKTGLFQVANGSHITVDCTHIRNSTSNEEKPRPWDDLLFDLVHKQRLSIDYQYRTVPIFVNLAFLALSASDTDAVYSIFNFPLRFKWEPHTTSSFTLSDAAASDSEAAIVREYFTRAHQLSPSFSDDNNVQDKLVETMINLSVSFPKWNNHDALVHNNIFSVATALFRAQALSMGREAVNEEDIEFVNNLEKKRMERHVD